MAINTRDRNFVFSQTTPATVWTINHNLDKYTSVVLIDENANEIDGEVKFNSVNTVTVTFAIPVAGKAFIN